jgi:hypothetical protein
MILWFKDIVIEAIIRFFIFCFFFNPELFI